MSKKLTSWLILLLAPVVLFTGWSNNSITNYYYYKGQPFELTVKSDRLFIKLKDNVPAERLNSIISDINEISPVENANADAKETKFFLTVNNSTDASLIGLSGRLMEKPEVEYASPVFSPDGGKTLIGVENEILVQFRPSFSVTDAENYIESKGLTVKQKLDLTGGASYILTVNQKDAAIDVANDIYRSGNVNWSEPNLMFTNVICYTPNDPNYNMQWSLNNTGTNIPATGVGNADCDMDVDSAWNLSFGNNKVIIAISDTGIDTLHEDLASNMVPGTGFNFYNNTPGGNDDGNHGTACAGINAAKIDNNLGVAGVAPNSRLIASKWLNSSGNGNYAGAVGATIWSYQKGAWVISNSWGFVNGASSALDQAIDDATTLGRNGKGSVFVVASGNENGAMRFPASTHQKVLVVGGISPCNQRKSTTSCDLENFWGASYGTNLHVVAPCVKIYTTDRTGSVGYSSGNYTPTFNGTSSATPNVSGVCALVLSADSTLTWAGVRDKIVRTSEKRGTYTYAAGGPVNAGLWNNQMGYGLVNAYAAVKLTIDAKTDAARPVIYHTALPNMIELLWPATLNAKVKDNLGVDSVWVKWYKNTPAVTKQFKLVNTSDSSYSAMFNSDTTEVAPNDVIYYRIFAQDIANAHNRDSSSLYSFTITGLTGTEVISTIIPDKFALEQNFPNPFNPATSIHFALPKQSFVNLKVYDMTGKVVSVLVNEVKGAGIYNVNFNAAALSSGMYFYRIQAGEFVETRRMMLVK